MTTTRLPSLRYGLRSGVAHQSHGDNSDGDGLYDRGQLALDEPVATTLPEFVALAPRHHQAERGQVTMRMLLAHSSGLPAYEKLFQFAKTREDVVRSALTARLLHPPGTHTDYSDIGFIILGEALAKKAGVALDVFPQREIFVPLGMAELDSGRRRNGSPRLLRPRMNSAISAACCRAK